MTGLDPGSFARLRAGLPALQATTELILRPDGDRPLAMLRPVGSPPRAFVLDGDRVVELRPEADERLPAAELFADEARMAQVLEPTLGPVDEARLVAWRPGRRAVVAVEAGGATSFVKFLDRRTYKRAKAIFKSLADAPPPLHFARAAHLVPDYYAYVAACAPGTSLRELLGRGDTPPWPLVDAAIRSLAQAPTAEGMPHHGFDTARDAGVKMMRKALPLEPELEQLADDLARLDPPDVEAPGFVHGDLHDKQIFLTDTTAHLIDLEGVGHGDTNFDLVNLAEQVRLRALQQGGADDGVADALLDRFQVPTDLRRRWRVCVRARLCGVYALRPRWTDLTRRLMSEVRELLASCQ